MKLNAFIPNIRGGLCIIIIIIIRNGFTLTLDLSEYYHMCRWRYFFLITIILSSGLSPSLGPILEAEELAG